MAKSSGRVALYELVNKARFKSSQEKMLCSTGVKSEQPSTDEVKPKVETKSKDIKADVKIDRLWSAKPRPVRIYPDRIELCFSWQVMIIGLLALVAIFMVFFRWGQAYSGKKSAVKESLTSTASIENIMPQPKAAEPAAAENTPARPVKMVEPMGDHVIVIASYDLSSHLEPVRQYYAGLGIATNIVKSGSRYLLITQERFDNPDKKGTNGFEMKNKIMSIGANYRPPKGSQFETFGTKPFQDAYGMKVN
ncbi:MAG: hypothetical protein JW806_04875 [Sedimentisphaerales bacterium]|nr:hypothetical protein [Sedimentisphaerales bacterium]